MWQYVWSHWQELQTIQKAWEPELVDKWKTKQIKTEQLLTLEKTKSYTGTNYNHITLYDSE